MSYLYLSYWLNNWSMKSKHTVCWANRMRLFAFFVHGDSLITNVDLFSRCHCQQRTLQISTFRGYISNMSVSYLGSTNRFCFLSPNAILLRSVVVFPNQLHIGTSFESQVNVRVPVWKATKLECVVWEAMIRVDKETRSVSLAKIILWM